MLTIGTMSMFFRNHSRGQVKMSTDNRSIFDRVCHIDDREIYRIPEYADNAIRTAIKMVNGCNDFICASMSSLMIILQE